MRLPEQRLWDRFRSNMRRPQILLNRVENAVGVGDPDVESIALTGGIIGAVSKIELKAIEDPPKRPTTPLLGRRGLSSDQENWLYNWVRHGGRAYVLIGLGVGPTAEQVLVRMVGDKLPLNVAGIHPFALNELPRGDVVNFASARTWDEIYAELGRP